MAWYAHPLVADTDVRRWVGIVSEQILPKKGRKYK